MDGGEILNIFACFITDWEKEGEDTSGNDNNDNENKGGGDAEDKNTTKKGKAKQATAETLANIADDCDNVLAFVQAVSVKSPRVTAAPLSLRADKRAHLVLLLDRHQPPHAAQAGPTRPHGSHGRLD